MTLRSQLDERIGLYTPAEILRYRSDLSDPIGMVLMAQRHTRLVLYQASSKLRSALDQLGMLGRYLVCGLPHRGYHFAENGGSTTRERVHHRV